MTAGGALDASDAENHVDASARPARGAASTDLRPAPSGQTFGADSPQLAAAKTKTKEC
ncbi:hypothetical protein [Streptomyces sp. NBC_01571]|uniref:hypothetical protein n=1 Tax=Streptomyces sp. NBC_01571 TaxID=2975883 RepID=UPI002B1CAD41|nr:hypothetical protein [Streptomyces sp. NBC_01571]